MKGALRYSLALSVLLLIGCAQKTEVSPPATKLELSPVSFAALPDWGADRHVEALPALRKSCTVFEKKDPDYRFSLSEAGTASDWLAACAAAQDVSNDAEARAFFETYFTPYTVKNAQDGLFTGYYEAQLRGSWTRGGKYQTPLWTRPDDMLTIDLGDFRDSWAGQKITGKIAGTKFVPYDDRARVAQGSLDGRAKPLLWVDDPIGAFFLEIQGSGQIKLEDESVVRVGYAAQNGHGYTPVGRVLADRGEIEKPVTMEKIRGWFAANQARAQEVMNQNPSVVFFKRSDKDGAVGAQGVTLTPLRSLAVDPKFVPLGVPLWLATNEHRRLVVAQDTGGAIKGAVRGDLFWGSGPQAEEGAGPMQNTGTYYLLLPKRTGS